MKHIITILIAIIGFVNCRLLAESNCGRDVERGELPFHASLQYFDTNEHFASAAILNARWVLSTARGLFGRPADSVNIIFGAIQFDKPISIQRATEFRIHPSYDPDRKLHDIATIRGSIAVNFPPFIGPATLSPLFVNVGTQAQLSGWNPYIDPHLATLQETDVETVQCIDTEQMIFTDQHLCAKVVGQDSSTKGCGKYPGSLLVDDFMIIGLKFHTGIEDYESMYGFLRISSYRNWVMGNIPI